MNANWITLRDIEYLLAVSRLGHFAKAAEACHVSQPALSTQIRKFEERLGIQIFERDNRSVRVTEQGRAILAQAQRVAEEASLLVEKSKSSEKPLSGEFRLGAIATIGPYLLPKILLPFRKTYPNCKLFLKEGLTDELLQELDSGELDAVIAADTFTSEKFSKTPLYFEPFLAAVPKGHRLEGKKQLSTREIDAREMVLLEDGHCLSDQVLELCPKGKGVKRESFQTTSLETLRHLVASGVGYTLIPQLALLNENSLETLITYIPFEKSVGRQIVVVSRKRFSRFDEIKELSDFIKKVMSGGKTY